MGSDMEGKCRIRATNRKQEELQFILNVTANDNSRSASDDSA